MTRPRMTYGFIGLGRMGGPMAANLAKAGFPLSVYDSAGTEARAPSGARCAAGAADIATMCDAAFLSLPTAVEVLAVLAELCAAAGGRLGEVIDLSTIGVESSQDAAKRCAASGVFYCARR